MCLAVPGKIVSITGDDQWTRTAKVSFGGVVKEINLAYLPEVQVGHYVIVHAGFALSQIDEAEAVRMFEDLTKLAEQIGEADEALAGGDPDPGAAAPEGGAA